MWLRAAVLVLAGVVVYSINPPGQFLFDDESAIVTNASLRQLSPLSVPFSPPRDTPVAGRPLVNFTFALNYAAAGLDVRSYQIVNLAVHLLAGLALFGLVRHTLLVTKLIGRFGPQSLNLSWACALIWTLHPLNSEVVNYLPQRTESLMGLFYLLTVYCAVRAFERPSGLWQVASVLACTAGMACKESMVTAPVMVALYDRVFLFDSVKEAARRRWPLYAGLAASWVILIALMVGTPRSTAGFGSGTDPWVYLLNQAEIITAYLRLTVWPRALVLDYGLPRVLTLGDVILPLAFLTTLGVLTLVAMARRPFVGFFGAWFFITLAPTSSFIPIATEVGAERRMYLPLAALVVLAVVGSFAVISARSSASQTLVHRSSKKAQYDRHEPLPWIAAAALAIVCVLLSLATVTRNRDYQSRLAMAQTIVERRPHGRAHFLLGTELVSSGDHDRAMTELRASAVDYPGAHYALATELLFAGHLDETITHAREFIRLKPDDRVVIPAREILARALGAKGNLDAAAEQFTLIIGQVPDHAVAHAFLGDILLQQRRVDEALSHYQAATKGQTADPVVLGKLGIALAQSGRMDEAIGAFERAVAGRPTDVGLLNMLGQALASRGRYPEAVVRLRRVVELVPSDAQAARNLAAIERLAAR